MAVPVDDGSIPITAGDDTGITGYGPIR
jgi:hypothetical protein